ncbi:MAG TPA: hypothetical protein VL593_17325 [Ramlibacter sp.]|jgi:hypothetical protein|nr:hypothetical protein [Ramlibacter sp.]
MRLAILALVLPAAASCATTHDADWLSSAKALEFRDRVVQLALIYGDSSGIDPQGFKILTRAPRAVAVGGCADVEVVTSKDRDVVRREMVHACRAH